MFIHKIFRDYNPDKPLFFGEVFKTYGDLQEAMHLYRNILYDKGIRKGDRVGIYSANRPEFVFAYMAIVSLGAIAVPINNYLVSREASYIVKDAGIRLMLGDTEIKTPAEFMFLEELDRISKEEPAPEAPVFPAELTEEDVCSLVYTSGTTGTPKGAMLTHRNLWSNAEQFNAIIGYTGEDNVLCVLPMFHCYGWTTCVINSLCKGGAITVLRTKIPTEIVHAIIKYKVTIAFMVPPMYNLLAHRGNPSDLESVRMFISGGASLPQPVAQAFKERYHTPILEGYGLTEASPVVAVLLPQRPKYLSVGPVLPGMESKIVTDTEGPYVPGLVGELWVRGANVMKGYWHKPEETEKVITPDGWLRTGDLAYQDVDEYIYIVDRMKDLVVVNGENIFPGEVEDCIYENEGISECAVIGHPDKLRGEVVWAYVSMKEGYTFDEYKMRKYMLDNLAAYKIPRRFVVLDTLPKSPTGKILKRVLRKD